MTKLKRPIRVNGDVAYITLTKGYVAIIDAADVPLVSGSNWCAQLCRCTVYTVGTIAGRKISLHRAIMSAPIGMEVDHLNGDGLDCRRANMRLATRAQNARNQRLRRNSTSGKKGVVWNKMAGKWVATIGTGSKNIHLGCFDSLEKAACAYDAASEFYHGEFGRVAGDGINSQSNPNHQSPNLLQNRRLR